MVYIRRLAAALAATACAAVLTTHAAHVARAQTLARLTVQSFTLSTDSAHPQAGVPLHLIVTLRVREPVTRIDNLELPLLAQLELQGDERSVRVSSGGTLYRETISVVAASAGDVNIGPAMLQAIDPRDHRAKQYATNGLVLHVVAAPGQVLNDWESAVASAAFATLRILLWLLGIGCVIALAVLIFRRRRARVPRAAPVAVAPAVPVAPPASPRDRLRDAYTVLAAARTRATAVRVRGVVWQMIGASEGETLADVLRRAPAADAATRDLLLALERAAFTYDDDLPAAIDHACRMLERCIQT